RRRPRSCSSSGCPSAASRWPRPRCTWRRRRSRTPSSPRSTPPCPTCAAARSAPCRRTCATGITRARRSWATRWATATRPTTPTAWWPSSTRPTNWPAATTTPRRHAAPSARWPSAWSACAGSPAERTDVHRELHGAVGPVGRGVPLAHHEVQIGQGAAGHDVAAVELRHPARGVVLVVPPDALEHGRAGRGVQVGGGGVQHEDVHAVVAVVEQREHPPVLDPAQRQLAEATGQDDGRRPVPAPAVVGEAPRLPGGDVEEAVLGHPGEHQALVALEAG